MAVPVYKYDACIWWSRPDREGDGLSRVEPNSCTTHCIRYSLLSPHKVTSVNYTGGYQQLVCQPVFLQKMIIIH
jgi:hypothetical protein